MAIGILGIDGKANTNPKVLSSYQISFMKSTVRLFLKGYLKYPGNPQALKAG